LNYIRNKNLGFNKEQLVCIPLKGEFRKYCEAAKREILRLLSKEFIKWILLANFIAWPVSYYIMNIWLQNFAYRTRMTIWMFAFSAATALLVALVTVSYQTVRAASANPVEALKNE